LALALAVAARFRLQLPNAQLLVGGKSHVAQFGRVTASSSNALKFFI